MIAALPAAGFALLLVVAALFSWILAADARACVRPDIRFAAMLFAVPGCAGIIAALEPRFDAVADAAVLLASPLAAIALALAALAGFLRAPSRLIATAALTLGCAAGLLSAVTGLALPSLTALAAGAIIMFIAALGRLVVYPSVHPFGALRGVIAGIAFLGGGLCLLEDSRAAPELFFATGLLGMTLALRLKPAVEEQGSFGVAAAIGKPR